jgi:hypothetical protein
MLLSIVVFPLRVLARYFHRTQLLCIVGRRSLSLSSGVMLGPWRMLSSLQYPLFGTIWAPSGCRSVVRGSSMDWKGMIMVFERFSFIVVALQNWLTRWRNLGACL